MSAKIVQLSNCPSAESGAMQDLLDLLEQGQIIGMPTETCYGLAARCDLPESLKALAAIKGRPADQTFTWHVGSPDKVLENAMWPALTKRLTDAFWPGPLTLVLPMNEDKAQALGVASILSDGQIGVRLPRHAAIQELLAQARFPIVMSSANATGEPPMTGAQQVLAAFGSSLAAVAEGGESELGGSSTVLAVRPGRFEILRGGRIALEDLQKQAGLRILFVCTGNTCRSPMAEGIARQRLSEALAVPGERLETFGFRVSSAGIYANAGSPVTPESAHVLTEWDVDIQDHRSSHTSLALEQGLDRIYCLTESHMAALRVTLPESKRSSLELLCPQGRGIPDPIGGSEAMYRETRNAISKAIDARLKEWI